MIRGLLGFFLCWGIVIGLLLTAMDFVLRAQQARHEATCVKGKIISIGGCNKEGSCGVSVQAKDEVIAGVWAFPTLGQTVCIRRRVNL